MGVQFLGNTLHFCSNIVIDQQIKQILLSDQNNLNKNVFKLNTYATNDKMETILFKNS